MWNKITLKFYFSCSSSQTEPGKQGWSQKPEVILQKASKPSHKIYIEHLNTFYISPEVYSKFKKLVVFTVDMAFVSIFYIP